jgi:hypothetical protein
MSHNTFRRFVIVLTLLVVLGTPLVSFAGPHRAVSGHAESRVDEVSPLTWLWSLLERVWEKEGCSIDPYGQCATEPVTPKIGCSIDPFGRCLPEPMIAPKAGCRLDPNGQCLPD